MKSSKNLSLIATHAQREFKIQSPKKWKLPENVSSDRHAFKNAAFEIPLASLEQKGQKH